MKASVIIPIYNEEDVIGECLESLASQSIKEFEVIVVDDGSRDDFKSVIKKSDLFKSKKLKLLSQSHKGPALARNLGAKKAIGKVLVFVDADMTFDKDFLKNLIRPILDGKTKGAFSKEEYVSNWDNKWARCWNYNEGWEPKRRHPKEYPDRQRVFRALLRSEFNRVQGFDEGGYTDDYTLSWKLGYKASAVRGAKFYHKNPSSLSEIYNHSKWVAKRKYKMGVFGAFFALIRASIFPSIFMGLVKAIKFREPKFVIFKTVYAFGNSIGILEYGLLKKGAK